MAPCIGSNAEGIRYVTANNEKWGRLKSNCYPLRTKRFATWNVEGMRGDSSIKLQELFLYMTNENIDVLCIQETHLNGAEYYEMDGFMVYLSGSRKDDRNYTGVGFIVAPWTKTAVITFHAVTERIGSLRLKVHGGTLTILSVYAPHDKHPFEDRHQFFSDVVAHTKSDTKHHATMVLWDFKAKFVCVMVGEENMIGEHVFIVH